MALALNTQGGSFYIIGDYTKAIDYYTKSLKIQEELGKKSGIAISLVYWIVAVRFIWPLLWTNPIHFVSPYYYN